MEADTLDLESMDDEAIMNIDPGSFSSPESKGAEDKTKADDSKNESAEDDSDQENPDGEADGAATEEGSSEDLTEAGNAFADEQGDSDSEDSTSTESGDTSEDDQSEDKGDTDTDEENSDTDDATFEAKYKELMAPFRAAKREVSLDNIEDARRLMQMGVDYSQKMQAMKPHQKILRTLEKAKLTDPSRINFLIDLSNNNPEAIKKLLKDNDIDPMTLNLEGSESYEPTDHTPGDKELAVRDVLDNIKDSPSFEKTVDIISNQMDTVSREKLQESPEVIAEIHNHIEAGIYQKVIDRVENERMYGRLTGLSDLQAYYQVGDAMYKEGVFDDTSTPNTPSTSGKGTQGSAQDSGSAVSKGNDASKTDLRNRKRAASPTKGKPASGGKVLPVLADLDDDAILALDPSSF